MSAIAAGERFGRLEVLHRLEKRLAYRAKTPEYVCECECGEVAFVRSDSLKSGYTKSCGCLARENCARVGRATTGTGRKPDCHPDRQHEAHGLCGPCYAKSRPKSKSEYDLANLKKSLKRAGATEEWYYRTLEEQDGKCAICGGEPNGAGRLHIDHCHTAGTPRGLLCTNCNPGIGYFKDDPALLRAAIEYLESR